MLQGQTSGIESEATSSEFQDMVSVDRSPPSQPPPTPATGGSEPSGRAAEERSKGTKSEGGGEGAKGGGTVTRVDSGIEKDEEWVSVQRKKKSNRQDGRVSLWCERRKCLLTEPPPTAD